MAVPDIFRNVTRNVREALSSREGFKEKAKELPLYVLQTTLSGVGQALMLGDRVRNTIKRLAGQNDETEESEEGTGKAADQPVGAGEHGEETAEAKPARREPVIFAPRPEKVAAEAEEERKAEANGTKARPEPVIFAPAKSKAAAEPAPERAEPETGSKTTPETAPTAPAPKTAEPTSAETGTVEAETGTVEKAGAVEAKTAEPRITPKVTEPEGEAQASGLGIAEPAAVKVEVTAVEVAKPEVAGTTAVEVTETKVAEPVTEAAAPVAETVTEAVTEEAVAEAVTEAVTEAVEAAESVLAEPMPGYGGLTVASLRARMRGKSAAQIQELLDYERATSARAEVVRMYENRLAKLEAAG